MTHTDPHRAGGADSTVTADDTEQAAEAGAGSSGIVRGAGWLGLGAGVAKASQTLVLLILAALLAPSAIGVLAVGALVLNVCAAVTDLGTSVALVRWRGDAERAARTALTLALAVSLALTGAAWLAAPALAEALNAGDLGVDVIRGLIWCLPLYAVAGVSHELLRRDLLFKRRVLPDIVGALVGSALSVALAVAGHGAMSLVVGQIVQAAIVAALGWWVRPPVWPGWRREDAAGLLSYGIHMAGANVMTLLMLNVDYLVVAHLLGSTALGVYSMAFRIAYMPYVLVAFVIGGAVLAHLSRRRGAEIARAVTDAGVVMATVMLPLYVGLLVLAPQLELLGPQWAAGVAPLRWLAAYGLALSAVHLCSVTLNAIGHPRDAFLLTTLHLAMLTALLLVLTSGGVERAAIAQAVAVAATLLAAVPVLSRRVDGLSWRPVARRLGPVLAGTAALATTGLAAQWLLPWTNVSVVGLVLVGTACLAAYLLPVLRWDPAARSAVAGLTGWRR